MPYYVYVIELDKEFSKTSRAIRDNHNAKSDK